MRLDRSGDEQQAADVRPHAVCQKPPTAARNHRASFGSIAAQEGTLIVRPSPRLQSRLFIGVGAPRKLLRCLPGLPTQAFVSSPKKRAMSRATSARAGRRAMGILSVGFRRLRLRNDAGRQEGEGSEQADVLALGLRFCSSLYLILQRASFWRWPVHCRWWSGSDHFFPRNRDGVKECLQRRLAEAPAALMRSLLVVTFDP
jgi:hypothetical protein